ncbi:MAG: hypothetical protein IPM97_14360 [Bdellovibrionaceae bacterium]|nr:hypothetical protein [Pseudobdellovibrionaceae bacterium]
MKLEERSYSSKTLRPRPTIYAEQDGSLLIITTSWGEAGLANKVNEDIAKYVQAATADVEVTSPFEFMTCLTDEANYLRVAALICNESLYRSDNRGEYVAGLETLILYRKENKVAFAQVGAPNLMLQKKGLGLTPISANGDTAFELADNSEGSEIAPLPRDLLGIDSSLNIRCGDFRIAAGDRLFLYSGIFWSDALWTVASNGGLLPKITQNIARKNPDSPFWIGLVSFESGF